MTVHDELVLELIKPDNWGKPTGYLVNIVGSKNIRYTLEELYYSLNPETPLVEEYIKMTPDIVVTNSHTKKTTAIELEGDIKWDFAHSLRQVKKYRRNSNEFQEVVVIIPKRYERFAMLYTKEGFRVYLWEATRTWECRCGKVMEDDRTVKPRCKSCKSTELEFKGVKDVKFRPFEYSV